MLTEALVHSPLALYFVAIAALLATVLPLRRLSLRSILFLAFALLSLALTWNAMFMYFERSFVEAALRENVRVARYTTTRWLSSTSLFDEGTPRPDRIQLTCQPGDGSAHPQSAGSCPSSCVCSRLAR